MYYVIETDYSDEIDGQTFTITTEPAEDKWGNPITEGRFGTTIGVYEYAHGAYETLEEARQAVSDLCDGEFREEDFFGEPYRVYEEGSPIEVESYKPGRYYPMDAEGTENHLRESSLEQDVKPWSTQEDLEKLFDELDAQVKEVTGCSLHENTAMKYLENFQKEVIKEWTYNFMQDYDLKGLVTAENTDEDLEKVLDKIEADVMKEFRVRIDRDEAWEHLDDYRDNLIEEKALDEKAEKAVVKEAGNPSKGRAYESGIGL